MEALPKHDDNQFGLEEADEVALMKASYEQSLERQRQKTIMQTLHQASRERIPRILTQSQ